MSKPIVPVRHVAQGTRAVNGQSDPLRMLRWHLGLYKIGALFASVNALKKIKVR